MPEPLIIADPDLRTPPGRDYWATEEMFDPMRLHPRFSVQETAKCFFGRSNSWLRHRLIEGYEIDGEPFEPRRTVGGDRYFRLVDIERWAHSLAEARMIEARDLELVVIAVKNTARLHGFII